MKNFKTLSFLAASTLVVASFTQPVLAATSKADLGKILYFDFNLSLKRTQSCSTCHNPEAGFVDDRNNKVNKAASMGDNGTSIGDRTAPTAAYAKFSPDFHYDKKKKRYIGGQFWDGRAKDLETQAGGPPLNPDEMAMPDKQTVLQRIHENEGYKSAFVDLYGEATWNDAEKLYDAMAESIAAFERTDYFSPFDSKYDRYLKGEYEMTAQEELGMSLFFSNNNTNCSTCHMLKGEEKPGETFTNYEYHNIGTPVNTALRAKNGVAQNHIDRGLLNNPEVNDKKEDGKFKVPTLRNIAVTSPYMHNSVFKDLRTVIEFYDQFNNPERSVNPETNKPWGDAEVAATVNKEDLKAKKLTDKKIDALIAFLNTLTDQRYEYLLEQ